MKLSDITPDNLYKFKHNTFLRWEEPWPAYDSNGKKTTAHVIYQATINDCINFQRALDEEQNDSKTKINDFQRLQEFIIMFIPSIVNNERESTYLKEEVFKLKTEINCRIEHGAKSGGHLEYVENKLKEILENTKNL